MSEIIQSLTNQGCSLNSKNERINAITCSNSFIQKSTDKPWSIFIEKGDLKETWEKLTNLDGINVSGIGMGSLEENGAWSKIKKFDMGKHIELTFLDDDLYNSKIKDKKLKERITRVNRLSNNFFTDYGAVDIGNTAQKEISKIQNSLEKIVEEKYNKSIGNTICSSSSEAKRMWMPSNNDVLKFKITLNCILPNEMTENITESVEKIGNRKTFQTTHRNGIDSYLTADKNMFLRRLVFHDRNFGGPMLVFGVRNPKYMKSPTFIEKLKAMESSLS